MLQQGANLRDITEVLRHRAPRTTEIYAKIDMRSLNEVSVLGRRREVCDENLAATLD
jgi:site-specific recombinase XerD